MEKLKQAINKLCPMGARPAPYHEHQQGMLFYGMFDVETNLDLSYPLALICIEVWKDKGLTPKWTVKLSVDSTALYNSISYTAFPGDCEGRLLEAIQAFARLNEWPPVRFQEEE